MSSSRKHSVPKPTLYEDAVQLPRWLISGYTDSNRIATGHPLEPVSHSLEIDLGYVGRRPLQLDPPRRVGHVTAMPVIAGPAARALESLSQDDVTFLENLEKAELHAHLHGSIPLECLQELAHSRGLQDSDDDLVKHGIRVLEQGVQLDAIGDFFKLFPAIHQLTSTPANLKRATDAVLDQFLSPCEGHPPQFSYLELRSTPRKTEHMSREEYIDVVLSAMQRFPKDKCAYIVSVDWRMNADEAMECIDAAISAKKRGGRVVGVDICGDFQNARPAITVPCLNAAAKAGFPLVVHIAETALNPLEETDALLALNPARLGHATFLNQDARNLVLSRKIPVEICLTSNILCKTVTSVADHHALFYIENNHPVAICTDDTLPFRTTGMGEYALLCAQPPLGLGLSREAISKIAQASIDAKLHLTT